MSQITRDEILSVLSGGGGTATEEAPRQRAASLIGRAEILRVLDAEAREGSLSKLPPAFAQGTVNAAASVVGASGLVGQGVQDAAVGAGSVLAPGAMRRGGGLQTGSQPISTGRVASLGGGPVDPAVQAQVDAEAADVPRLWSPEAPIAQAAAEVSDTMKRWGQQRFAFTPSSGLVAGTLENAAMSAPTTVAGAGIGVGVGAVTGNPAAGLAAGSAFMALTDAAGVMEETYAKGKAAGLSERDAVVKANQVGAVYAGASALLERVGLGSILRATGPVSGSVKKNMLAAALRAGEAAATEGVTEVAQGVAQRGLQAYALDDWQGFTEAYTQSDEPLKEFMAGALLGGGIRGVGEAANPANYKSAKDYQKAATVQTARVEEALTAPGLVTPERVAAAAVEPVEDPEGGEAVRSPADSGDPAQWGADELLAANRVAGQIVEPRTPEQVAVVERFAKNGIRVVYVDGGKPLNARGSSPAPGVVILDANMDAQNATQEAAWHEAVHDVERRSPGVWQDLRADLQELAPNLMAAAEASYRRRWGLATRDPLSETRLAQEGPSTVAELVIDAVLAGEANGAELGQLLLTAPPTIRDRLISALQALLRAAGLRRGATRLEVVKDRLARQKELGGPEAIRAAVLIRDAVAQLRPEARQAQSGPDKARPSQTEPDASRRNQTEADPRTTPDEPGQVGPDVPRGTPDGGVAVAEPVIRAAVRNPRTSEFSNAAIKRRLRQAVNAQAADTDNAEMLSGADAEAIATEFLDTNFSGPLGQDITSAIQGLPPNIRTKFKGNVPGGMGEDIMAQIGADEMVRRVMLMAEGQDARMERVLRERGADQISADAGMLEAVMRAREGKPASEVRPYEVVENPGELPVGATFRLEGSTWIVARDRGWAEAVSEDGRDRFNLDGVEAMPVDSKSLKRNAGAVPAEVDPLDGVPFSLRPEPRGPTSRDLMGRPIFEPATGRQQQLPMETESPIAREDRERRERQARENGDDPGQGTLFSIAPPVGSEAFRRWFGDSKVVDQNGNPLVVYHQTSRDSERAITEQGGFRLDLPGARATDDTVPDGIFAKPDTTDIGVGASQSGDIAQMPLFMALRNPFMAKDRDELRMRFFDDDEFSMAVQEARRADREIARKYDEAEAAFRSVPKDQRDEKAWERQLQLEDRIIEDGKAQIREASARARARMTEMLRTLGYDGVIIENDAGSFGRRTKTFIALDPRQVKSTSNRGSFDPSNPNILFSLRDPDSLNAAAVAHFGTTEDPREAGYILTSGRMLDLSGRHRGRRFEPGVRRVLHEDLPDSIGGGIDGMLAFMRDSGAVRYNHYARTVNLAAPATAAQRVLIARNLEGTGSVIVEVDIGERTASRTLTDPSKAEIERAIRDAGRTLEAGLGDTQTLFSIAPPTDSPEFRRWFGNSKVVNEDGTPKVVYHGTNAYDTFTRFNGSKGGELGPGSYFTDDPARASGYAQRDPNYSRVMPVFIRLQNPIVAEGSNPQQSILRTIYGSDGVYNRRSAKQAFSSRIITQDDIRKARAMGYDGVLHSTGYETEYTTFEPEQVKSATGNRGTFDPANPDIRFSLAPEPELPGMTPAQTRITPEGRPDLANPGRTEPVRGFVSAVDELRNRAGQPEATTFDAIEQEAARRMSRDYDGEVYRAKQKVQRGEALTAEETVILAEDTNRQAQRALRTESSADLTDAVRTAWQYRQSGTIAARALGIRRDRVMGPRQRYREALMNAVLLPSPKVRAKLERIAAKLADPELSDTERTRLEEQQETLFDREGKKVQKVREDLIDEGIDPRLITPDTMQDPTFAATVTDIARRARTDLADSLYWVWMNSILSGPLTHAANLIGNFTNIAYRMGALRGIEATLGTATGGRVGDVTVGEYAYMLGKVYQSAAAGWQTAVQAWSTNRQVFEEQVTGETLDLFELVKGERTALDASGPRNRLARLAGLNGIPLKLLSAEDQFFKAFAGNLHAHALAYRQAKSEGLSGEAVGERVEALLEDWQHPIWRESLDEAKIAVFQDDASVLGEAAMDLRRRIPGMKYIIPFIKTPDRLFVRGIEASPVGAVTGLYNTVMGVSQGDSKRAVRGLSTGIMSLGLLVTVAALREDDDGRPRITGSRIPNWRDADEQYRNAPPMSIRLGGQWYSYARIEPLSTGLALTVDMLDRMEAGDTLIEGMAGSWKSLLAVAEDKTFLRSIGEVLEAVRNPEQSGDLISGIARRTFVTAWVPNLFKQTARAFDPSIRDTRPPGDAGWWDSQAARLPSEALPISGWGEVPRYDLWGRPIERGSPVGTDGILAGLYRLTIPVNVSDADWHPMDRLVWNYNRKVREGQLGDTTGEDGHDQSGEFHPRPPGRSFTDRGETIELNADEYQGMLRDAGQRASERLLGMSMNIDDPGKADVRRIRRVFREEYDREKQRIARERRGG